MGSFQAAGKSQGIRVGGSSEKVGVEQAGGSESAESTRSETDHFSAGLELV